jgi:hypothetical protein
LARIIRKRLKQREGYSSVWFPIRARIRPSF